MKGLAGASVTDTPALRRAFCTCSGPVAASEGDKARTVLEVHIRSGRPSLIGRTPFSRELGGVVHDVDMSRLYQCHRPLPPHRHDASRHRHQAEFFANT